MVKRCLLLDDAACAYISSLVISLAGVYLYTLQRGVDKLEVAGLVVSAHHDTYVAYILTARARGEEYQVALLEFFAAHSLSLSILCA